MKDFINSLIWIAMFWFGYFVKTTEVRQKTKDIFIEIEKLKKLLNQTK